jgi:CubicO group peptidase (beta-lactamase class C family)
MPKRSHRTAAEWRQDGGEATTPVVYLRAMTYADIDAACAEFAGQERLPGLVAGIVREGRLVHVACVGRADLEAGRPVREGTAFRIASMTKHMTALALLVLRDRGRLVLDAPLSDYVPQFNAVKPATADSAPVTLRQLVSHAAGFVTDDPWADRVLGMAPAGLDALLGRVLTNVSGEPYQAFIRRTFLEPLGMARTTFDAFEAMTGDFAWGYREDDGRWSRERIEPDGEVGAMGGLVTTAPDYARWVAFLLSAWPARDDPETGPARRSTVRELGLWHSMPWPLEQPGLAAEPTAYGYGLMNSVHARLGRRLHHSGGLPGYGSHVLMLPDRGWGVFAFANRTYARASRLTLKLAEMLHDASPPAPVPSPSIFLAQAVESVVAAYNAGRIEVPGTILAVNFLLDTPAASWDSQLAALKEKLGEGRLEAIEPVHALSGTFTMACARGRLKGLLILSPDARPGVQKLTLTPEPARE